MKWIVILPAESTGKTKRWDVLTADRSSGLGIIKFYPQWRKYAFFPHPQTLYEEDCMRDIAAFLAVHSQEWRATKKKEQR